MEEVRQVRITAVIPALNEGRDVARALASVKTAPDVEVIVVDGGRDFETLEESGGFGAKVIFTGPGRAVQMNAGARAASGDILLFLHADTVLPGGYDGLIRRAMQSSADTVAGAFTLKIDSPDRRLRVIERLANWRSEALNMPYGDQAIFVRAAAFFGVGGFPEMPIMEDFALMRRLGRVGGIAHITEPVVTSARRWTKDGFYKTTLVNQAIIIGYMAGLPLKTLRGWYG